MSLIIFANDTKTAEALALRVPEFKDADTQIGYEGAREAIVDKTVLTDYIPTNMIPLAKSVAIAQCRMKASTRDKLEAEELANELGYVEVFSATKHDYVEAKKSWSTTD